MRSRIIPWLILIVIFGAGGVYASDRGWTHPAENLAAKVFTVPREALSSAARSLTDLFSALPKSQELAGENKEQRREIERLSGEIVRLREMEFQNRRLRSLLDYKDINPEQQLVVAGIVGRDPSGLVQSIAIDKGTEDGVREGMVVVVGNGLVGKIVRALDSSAKVLLVADPRSSVNAMVQRSRSAGAVNGSSTNQLVMEYLRQGERAQVGDLVLTSGLGGGFPRGILIGQVAAVEGNDLEIFSTAAGDAGRQV